MNSKEFPEESDSSDEDYVPDSKVEDAVSEVESDGDPEEALSGSDEESNIKGRKRTKKLKKTSKKTKVAEDKVATTDKVALEKTEDQKKKADDLWADFMKDTGFKSKNSNPSVFSGQTKTQQSSSKSCTQPKKADENEKQVNKVKITQVFEFAGEEVVVEKEVDSNSADARLLSNGNSKASISKKAAGSLSGIGNVLSQLGKKQKITTLEKSKLDWDRFKREENIEEELQTYNKGKDGYLDRQDFLQRADLRRFEIEKDIRNVERAKRFNNTL